ncbi:hypothetical protein GIB67_022116 [Kingdonia uniflora]|uniref:Uncharacterized protein n=1 Tax=Kingdonia uniflora TaxID=39325 RepID=A0A7J7LXS7_9MAGN|nr:hypothetical protein GIB67_022116 [Kingdonia uniflora]
MIFEYGEEIRMVRTRSQIIRHAAKRQLFIRIAKVWERIFGLLGYDAELLVRGCQLERLDVRGRELEYARHFYDVCFCELVRDPTDREEVVGLIAELKRVAGTESRRWLYSSVAREGLGAVANSHSNTEGFSGKLVTYPPSSDAFKEFCKAKAAVGGTWGNCIEYVGPKSQVERKDLLLDEVAKEEVKLEFVLEGLGLNIKKKVGSKLKKVQKSQSTRLMAGIDDRKKKGTGGEGQTNFPKTPIIDSSVQAESITSSKLAQTFPKIYMLKRLSSSGTTGSSEERARLAALHGEEDMSKMVTRLVRGIWLGVEEEKFELKKVKIELEKKVARVKAYTLKEVKKLEALKGFHAVAIGHLQVEARANLEEVVAERERLGRHLMLKGYFEDEVDAIRNAEARERSRRSRNDVKVPLVQGDVVRLLGRIRVLEGDVARIQGHVQKGNTNLREYQHKLDAALVREKVLEREIREKEILMKKKDDLLKDTSAWEGLNAEIERLHAQVTDLEAINQAESAKAVKKLEESIVFDALT